MIIEEKSNQVESTLKKMHQSNDEMKQIIHGGMESITTSLSSIASLLQSHLAPAPAPLTYHYSSIPLTTISSPFQNITNLQQSTSWDEASCSGSEQQYSNINFRNY